ncbi:hypothetical protein [Actinomycetospora soli]|uniref:hypothetical protein n=1 Tax=Actinomycetospora soli TaxID=2893887 RepID=UPI001E54910A|nr:hypothetical protein [Actinomycetospora soli]MCD2185718.1 hypothetical protein [Actinomycetospora soli]
MSTTVRADHPLRPVLGPTRFPLALPGWDGVVVTALVPPAALPLLRPRRPGETVRLALAIADHEVRPALVGADRWQTDARARLDARGTFGRRPQELLCSPGHLEVAGRRWSLGAGAGVREGARLEVAGVLHVAVGAAPDVRPWTIRGWRRVGRAAVVDLVDATPTGGPA